MAGDAVKATDSESGTEPASEVPEPAQTPRWGWLWALLPVLTMAVGVLPRWPRLRTEIAAAHEYWYDGVGHLYMAWERWQTLLGRRPFFEFRWFYPYPNSMAYNEPSLVQGVFCGLWSQVVDGEVAAFNLAMLTILLCNAWALHALIYDVVRKHWLAGLFSTVGALSPIFWSRYAHPTNTLLFPGLLALLSFRRSVRATAGRSPLGCCAAPHVR